jgi:hypothetical protein
MMIFIAQFPLPAIARLPESMAFLDKLNTRKAQIPAHAAETSMIAMPDRSILTIFIFQVLSLNIFQRDQDFRVVFLSSTATSSA